MILMKNLALMILICFFKKKMVCMNMKRLFFAIAICVAASWTFAQSDFYEGKGGAGISIEVVKAEVKGKFSDEQEWFPDFAVNMIHDDMEKYSAIRMIDGANLEAQMDVDDRNLNSGIFEIKHSITKIIPFPTIS